MITLSPIDFVLIAIYIGVILYIGWRSSIKETREGFLLADRKLGVFENSATIVSSNMGAGFILTAVGLVYIYGVLSLALLVGVSVGYLVFLPFATKLRSISSEQKFYTLSDYFFYRYGKKVGLLSAFLVLHVIFLSVILQLIGGAKVFGSLTGLSYFMSLIIVSSVIVTYLLLGGFKAVVKTDIVQFLSIIILSALIGFILFGNAGLTTRDLAFSSLPIKSLIAFILFGVLLPFASPEVWQRVYAAKSVQTLRKSLILSAGFYMLIGLFLFIVSLAIKASITIADPDIALVEGFSVLLPPGLIGLGVVIIFAAVMSSADTYLFTNTSVLVQDFYARFRKVEGDALIRVFRIGLVLLMLAAIGVSLILKSIIGAVFVFSGFAGILAIVVIASWLFKNIKGRTLLLGLIIGYVGSMTYLLIRPPTEAVIIVAIGFTLLGLSVGSTLNLVKKST